jgi:hypothetical protein
MSTSGVVLIVELIGSPSSPESIRLIAMIGSFRLR